MPGVDRRVVLDSGVGAAPGGKGDLVPEVPGGDGLRGLAVGALGEDPVVVVLDRIEELVGKAHGVVGVLPADREVGLTVEVVVEFEAEAFGHCLLVLAEVLHALDQCGDLDLLADLPVDEGFHVGVVHVEADHLGGAAGGSAGLDRARGPVADLEEAHQARASTATGQGFVLATNRGKVRSGSGAVLEEARLADPQVHDPAFTDEVVADALDEAGMRLRVGVGVRGEREVAGFVIRDPVALGRALDAVRPRESGVEPLGAVRGRHLVDEHEGELVVERLGVFVAGEVVVLGSPVAPAAGQPVDHLTHGAFRSGRDLAVRILQEFPLQVVGAVGLVRALRDARLAEVLAHDDVGGELTPAGGDFRIVHLEDERAIGVGDSGAAT